MLYNVASLLKSPGGTDQRHPIEGALDLHDADAEIVSPVIGNVRFQRISHGILATGDFTATVRLQCVRCLEPFDLPLTATLREVFLPTIDILTGAPLPPVSEEQGFTIDARHHLDLTEAIRQQVILNLPMQPLCRDDCAGLCPICGGNRNVRACSCVADEAAQSSIFAQLRALDVSEAETSQD